jgi:eukaryotic-like serine/threonine-protein kinase
MQEQIGNFRFLEKLGEGGMGEVYKGLDTTLEREVAIKLLRPELSNQPNIMERFRTEAVALARLNHPNIAMLHAFHQDSGQAYMIMEYVPGETLAQIMTHESRLPPQTALPLICQVLSGLEHAHRKNIVHRDIKPSNIMLSPDGVIKLMDFGIARILERSRLTKTGFLVGTLHYMSPEQIQGKETDRRSDIYSVGLVLYKLLTGRAPFDRNTDYETIKAQVDEHPGSPSQWAPEIDPAVERAVLRALAKDPSDRFESAEAFRHTLLAFCEPETVERTAPETWSTEKTELLDADPTKSKKRKRSFTPKVLAAAGLVLALGLGLMYWFHFDPYPQKLTVQDVVAITPAKPSADVKTDDQPATSDSKITDPAPSISEPPEPDVSDSRSSTPESSESNKPESASLETGIIDSNRSAVEGSDAITTAAETEPLTPQSDNLNSEEPRPEEPSSKEPESETANLDFPLPGTARRKPITYLPNPKPNKDRLLPLVDMPSR